MPKLCPSRSNVSKWFQTKPKVSWKIGIESTAWNYGNFRFWKYWSENPRVGSSILSLGTNWKIRKFGIVSDFLFYWNILKMRIVLKMALFYNFQIPGLRIRRSQVRILPGVLVISSTYEIFVSAFFVLIGPKSGTISIRWQFKLLISHQNEVETRGF